MSKALETLRKDIEVRINAYNGLILKKGDFAKMNQIEGEIRDAEAAYAEQQMREVFEECKKQPEPILAAVKRYDYPVLSHRLIREDGVVTEMVLVEDRTKQIDLVKLCKALGLSHLWEYKVEKFGNLLCMRAAKELGWSDGQIKQIERLYYCNALSRKEDMGTIPTSNNQIVKLLQQVIDAVLPADPETGKAKYRCNSHDVAYLLMAYTKRNGKKKLTIEVAKNSFVHRLVMDVMHRIVCGLSYDLKYQQIRKDEAEGKKPEAPAPQKAKKAETSETVSIPRPAPKKAEAAPAEVSAPEADELPTIDEVSEADIAKPYAMKVLSRVLCAIVIGYILVSMALSLLVSFGVLRWEIILHRAPFLLVDAGFSVVEGADAPDSKYGYDQHGEYIGFNAEVPEGSEVLTLMVYHPLNNYCDDIVQRFDIRVRQGKER